MAAGDSFYVRNLRFDTGESVPRFWHAGGRSVTRFFDNLSIFFPAGERFFIDSVKAYRHRATDSKLAAEVKVFAGQEMIHSREHVRYNDMLCQQGVPVAGLERNIVTLLRLVRLLLPRRWQLAATCALEHFTALMAHAILSNPSLLDGADPTMRSLWRWHAAEENEHKAVAFDVYRAMGGTYIERVAVMAGTTVVFGLILIAHQVRIMAAEGLLFSGKEWRSLLRYLFVAPAGGLLRPLLAAYLDYYRPSFHPWDLDNRALLENWKRELPASA